MGLLHFIFPRPFQRTVPSYFSHAGILVGISGGAELLCAIGILNNATQKIAAIGIICLLIAVFPANINMAMHAERWVREPFRPVLWLRLPLQFLIIAWAWEAGDF